MNVVASAWPADRDSDQPSRRLGRDRRWDRRVALLDSEAAALLAPGAARAAPQRGRGRPAAKRATLGGVGPGDRAAGGGRGRVASR